MKGLAIAGGGLKCVAQIGALKALDELGIKFDMVSGTSSGSMIASMYAMGCTFEEMEELIKNYYKKFTKFDLTKLSKGAISFLKSGIAKIDGVINTKELQLLLKEVAKKKRIDLMSDVKLPISIIAVDTITTKEVIFTSKIFQSDLNNEYIYIDDAPIDIAIRASTAFPGLFPTCNYKDYNLIDGGTKNNLPTEPLKAMGADKILALTFELDEYIPKKDLLAILLRTCDIFSYDRMEQSKKLADICTNIAVPGADLLSVDNFGECIKIGYNAIMNKKEEILKLFA
ncbi:MAG: patatin-like phospholipase family protein [Clostridia bacterium]|nr:patatin-like phospholipase family protein [Clostridia bacterium]